MRGKGRNMIVFVPKAKQFLWWYYTSSYTRVETNAWLAPLLMYVVNFPHPSLVHGLTIKATTTTSTSPLLHNKKTRVKGRITMCMFVPFFEWSTWGQLFGAIRGKLIAMRMRPWGKLGSYNVQMSINIFLNNFSPIHSDFCIHFQL